MNIITLQKKFNTHSKCIRQLEKVKWGRKPICPHCESKAITKRSKNEDRKTPMYHCNGCNKDFTVLVGTIFEGSKMPLEKWFALIALMLNARKGISAMQLSRDLEVTYKTAWYSAMRVRCAMLDEADMLEGIVEMDEAYIGGRPRKFGKKPDENDAFLSSVTTVKPKRGRGTKKIPIVGIVEREGKKRVVTKVQENLRSRDLLAMLKRYVKMDSAIVMTDEYRGYNQFDDVIQHLTINHKKEYANGIINTNTIEGFWSIVKNGIRGQYHVLSKKYLPFYLAEFSYKYNRRNDKGNNFDETIKNAVTEEKCAVNYKPKGNVRKLAYKPKRRKKNRAS